MNGQNNKISGYKGKNMKNITIFESEKYNDANYRKKGDGIYEMNDQFYISISFTQEPEFGEGTDSTEISQYPLEDILDNYGVFVSDFYEELNNGQSNTCYLEFASPSLDNVTNLLEIVDKHVFLQTVKEDERVFERLCIE